MISNSPQAWSERAAAETSFAAAMWSERGQRARFEAVLTALAPEPFESLLDFGCGTGDFSELMPDGVDYLGYDWAPGMIERATREHGREFVSTLARGTTFDLVAIIGPFNLRDNWSRFKTYRTIGDLWERTKRSLAACLFAGDDPDGNHIVYTEAEVEEFAADLSPRARVTRHLPNDLLLVLER